MKHVSILVPEGDCSVTNIEGPHQILSRVNDYLADLGQPPAFTINLVGLHHEIRMKRGLFTVRPDILIPDLTHTDLILIPSVHGDKRKILADNKDLLAWIVQQYHGGAAVASLCIGTFLLAGTGLLDDRICTTHWDLAGEFKEMFPSARLATDKIITDENNIYTSGGAYSWLNLIVYLVEKYAGREIAVRCAKGFQIDIQRVKMEVVKKSLETSRLGVNEAMDQVGYSDPKAFRIIFKKVTGLSPLQYRNRYNREFA